MKPLPSATFVGIAFVVLVLGIFAPPGGAQDLGLRLDHAVYRYDHQAALLEIFYSIDAALLTARAADTAGAAEAVMQLRVFRNDSLWAAKAWRLQVSAGRQSPNQIENNLVDVLRYVAPPGRYLVELSVSDAGNKASQTAKKEFQVALVSPTALSMSEIEMAAMIRKEEADSRRPTLYKNQMLVIPQPDCTYSLERPMLFYYFEIYQLAQIPGENFKVKSYVSDSLGNVISQVRGRAITKPKNMEASVEVGSLHLGALPAGRYWLHAEVLAANDQVLSKQLKSFVMQGAANLPAAAAMPAEAMQLFAPMSESQITAAYKQANYIMTDEQKLTYQQLKNLEAKKRFIAEFWWRHDLTPGTPQNEFYLDYLRRLDYANKNLRSFAREGWQTDRGRVYVVYGPPSDIDVFPSTEAAKPYERWVYNNLEGGVEFIFIDKTGFREFRLVHSSKIGEIQDPNWTKQLTN
jgi:GWxTD domain-containing protein